MPAAAAPTADEASAQPIPAAKKGGPGQRYTFTFPPDARLFANDPTSVSIAPLSLEQEIDGNKLLDKTNNAFDKVKMSIVAVNGKPVSWINGEVDTVIERASPPVRDLIMAGFMKIHNASQADRAAFLGTMTLEV